jgi:hypothetical protein
MHPPSQIGTFRSHQRRRSYAESFQSRIVHLHHCGRAVGKRRVQARRRRVATEHHRVAKKHRPKNPRRANHHLAGAELLSSQVIEIAYVHATDGQEYQHDFSLGVKMLLLRDGTVELRRDDGKPLWRDFP